MTFFENQMTEMDSLLIKSHMNACIKPSVYIHMHIDIYKYGYVYTAYMYIICQPYC